LKLATKYFQYSAKLLRRVFFSELLLLYGNLHDLNTAHLLPVPLSFP